MNPRARRRQADAALISCIVVHLLGTGSTAAGQEAPVAGQDMPVCRLELPAYQSWQAARTRMTGITASSADRFLIPTATASDDCAGAVDLSLNQSGRFDDGVHAWIAAARCKEVVCGEPYSLEPFCGGSFWTNECDLNNNIFVADGSTPAGLLERHQCLGDTVGLRQDLALEGGTLCFNKPSFSDPSKRGWLLHAEATAPYGRGRNALKAAWASQAEYAVWRSSLAENEATKQKEMCVYGPIVGDTGHGLKAEVHPVNMYWWTRSTPESDFAPGGPYDLLMIQDASARYSNEFGYVINEPFPESRVWRPWSQAPLVGQFEIPVWTSDKEVLAGTCASAKRDSTPQTQAAGSTPVPSPVPVFRVEPWRACEGAPTITDAITPPPEPQCVSRSSPRLYVEVAAKNTHYEKFDVSADWACQCRESFCGGPGYLGYLRVDGRVGLDRDFWEGALGLTVVDRRLEPAVPLPNCVPKPLVDSSRKEASRPKSGTIEARVRRILTRRSGREQEDLLRLPAASTLDTLLTEIQWPVGLEPPPVEWVLRPKEIRLDVATRVDGLGEEGLEVDIAKTWTVDVAPLPLAPDAWTTVVKGQEDDQVRVRLPLTDRPYKIRATVDLTPDNSRVRKPDNPIQQVLWSDRLALKESEMEGWIDKMSHVCDEPVRRRARARGAKRSLREGAPSFGPEPAVGSEPPA